MVLTLAYGTSLVASIIVAGFVYYFAPTISKYTLSSPLFINVLRIAALAIPFNTLANITYSIFKSIERMDYNIAMSSIANPTLRLIFVGGAVLLGYSLIGATAGLVLSGVVALSLSLVLLVKKTDLGTLCRPTKQITKEYYNFSVPLTLNQVGNILYNRVDIIMVGFLLSGSAVGIYNVAVLVSGLLALPLTAFSQLFPPIASQLYHNGKNEQLDAVYNTVTRWIFTLSLFPGIAVFLYAENILRVFGEGFVEGKMVLTLFVFAQLTNCAVGPSGFLLMMTDRQYLTLFNQLSSGILNMILNYILITNYGFIGAALATAGVLAGINILRAVEVWYLEGMIPYNLTFLKPIAASIFSGVAMYLLSFLFAGYILIGVGLFIGFITFTLSLYLLGIKDEEIDLLRKILQE